MTEQDFTEAVVVVIASIRLALDRLEVLLADAGRVPVSPLRLVAPPADPPKARTPVAR